MKSPQDFVKGMHKGSVSLFANSTYGVFNAASKITGSVSKSLVQLSGKAM
jgi:vacuolar protein sorting-associated protein 13A/C